VTSYLVAVMALLTSSRPPLRCAHSFRFAA